MPRWFGTLAQIRISHGAALIGFALSGVLTGAGSAQSAPASDAAAPVLTQPVFSQMESTDPATGVHAVRLLLSLPGDGPQAVPPRFTVECQERNGKHDMLWFVSFGGVADPGFVPPFIASQSNLFPPEYPAVSLKMSFEGCLKPKPFTRSWSLLPTGELSYRNPGMSSPNMDSTRYFLTFLNSLPGLRISYAKRLKDTGNRSQPGEVFFPTQPLLDALGKTPLCLP